VRQQLEYLGKRVEYLENKEQSNRGIYGAV